ncbi:hypothetical protein BN8_01192 [Fibrisoma limi BUZ 3]|uniref:TonB-dependent receptor plug n=1 Tax=Fibrisoma limi BUZ 3 TaxID=1185876 RepID=I2GE85_9BACT|nr:TonB-dependent receptor [Fibrisoma limi]CCH52210.1 hypothetical protein BN8_01192 [Fibrisoma limi BUZ 3]
MNRITTGWLLVGMLSSGPFLGAQDVASTIKVLPAGRLGDNTFVTLSAEGRTLDSILRDIEQQTAHTFVYSDDRFRHLKPSVQVVRQPLMQVLAELFTPLQVTYRIVGKQIILSNQDRVLTGQVVDSESGETLPGVNITVKGTNRGVSSDAQGNYRITLPNGSTTLVFSYVGYVSQEVTVGNENTLTIKLVADVRGLDEVQIVAFGEQRKRDLTGSIASIKSDAIRTNTAASPDVALQGRAAGVQITQAGGTPGGAVRINVRGVASINSNSQPLIVIDGVPVLTSAYGAGGIAMNPLAEINPNDIESLEVLKDASASVLYGSRAANGVILITTKKGKSGKPSFDVSYEEGVTSATNRVKFLTNPSDYFAVLKRAAAQNRLAGLAPVPSNLVNLLPTGILSGSDANINSRFLADSATLYNTSTDWLSETLRQGSYRVANLGISAGTNKLSVYASGSYRRDNGIVIGQSLERLSGRVNLTYRPIRQVQIGVNGSINGLETQTIPLGNSFRYALTTALPVYPVQLADGTYFNGINYGSNQINIGSNPVFYRNNYSNVVNTTRSINTAFLQVEPLPGLVLRTEWGYDFQKSTNDVLQTPAVFPAGVNGQERNGNGRAENRDATNNTWNTNNTLTYTRKLFRYHSLKILLGNSVQSQSGKSNTFITENVPEGARGGSDTARVVQTDDSPAFRFVSFFGRLNYAIQDKYLFEASFRTDGSSRFGPGRRFASFPGVSVGWVLSDEPFLRDRLKAVSLLKLRASYGSTGNAEIGNFSWQKTFTYVGYNAAIYGGIQGGQFTNPGNQDLSWETTRQFNAGLDFGLLNNRIQGSFDFYNKISDGLLLEYSLGPLYGTINNTMTLNLGSVRNRGLEFSVSSQNIVRPRFRWTTDFNIARNKNEVLSTYTASFLNYPYQFISGPSIAAVGYPLGTYYMPTFAGFDPATGNELFYERDRTAFTVTGQTVRTGNLWDGTINNQSANNQFIQTGKTPYPTFFGGLTNTFTLGQIDLSFLLYYQYGNWIYDQGERSQSYPTVGQVLRTEVPGIGNLSDEVRRAETGGVYRLQWQSNARGFESTRFLHDGSFVRLKNIQIGYSLPRETARRFRLRTARIYVTGQNLLTLTQFKGWDPEIFRNAGVGNTPGEQGTANLQPGVTSNDLPQVRTVSIGLNVGF